MARIDLIFPEKILDSWNFDKDNILESKGKLSQGVIFKFSFHPESGEFLCAEAPMHHNTMILSFGAYKFDEYVRGIYFKEKKTVYLRGHEKEDWLQLAKDMLRQYGVPKGVRIIWGREAAEELAEDLRYL